MKAKKGELPFARAFIDQHLDRIIDWSIGDVRRCCNMNPDGTCRADGALVGAFMLWCCAIDYFGGLYTGIATEKGTKTRMREFINKYMSSYDWQKIYDLRWSLLHFYSPHHYLLFHEGNEGIGRMKHLKQSNGGILLHLGCSIIDLEAGVGSFKTQVLGSDNMKVKIWRYFKAQPPIMPVKFEFVQPVSFSSLATGTSIQSVTASGTAPENTWVK